MKGKRYGRSLEAYRIGCITGTGTTKKAAREAAEGQAAEVLVEASEFAPVIVRYCEVLTIAVRTPDGWCVYSGDRHRSTYPLGYPRKLVRRALRVDVAHETWDGVSPDHLLLNDDPQAAEDFRRWTEFQRAHQDRMNALAAGDPSMKPRDFGIEPWNSAGRTLEPRHDVGDRETVNLKLEGGARQAG